MGRVGVCRIIDRTSIWWGKYCSWVETIPLDSICYFTLDSFYVRQNNTYGLKINTPVKADG